MLKSKSKRMLAAFLAGIILVSGIPVFPNDNIKGTAIQAEAAKKKNGWSGSYYYKNGEKVKGFKKIGKYYYYFDSKGKAYHKGWKMIKGQKYYFGKNKRAYVGVKKIGRKYYLFDSKGRRTGTGLRTYKGKKYYVKSGVIKTGLVTYKGKKYYSTRQGLKSGWVKIKGKQYYFDKKSKAMVKNKWIGDKYLGPKGYVTKTKKPSKPDNGSNNNGSGTTTNPMPESFNLQDGFGTYQFSYPSNSVPGINFKWNNGAVPDGIYTVNGTKLEFSYGYARIPDSWQTIETDATGKIRCRLIDGTYLKNTGIYKDGIYYFFGPDGYGYTGTLEGYFQKYNAIAYGLTPSQREVEKTLGWGYSEEIYVNGKWVDPENQKEYGDALVTIFPYMKTFREQYVSKCTTDLAKVLATTRYLCDQGFTYTQIVQGRGNFWSTKKGMCAQYAMITYELCCVAGIPVVAGANKEGSHAWNQVQIDRKWYHFDNTATVPGDTSDYFIQGLGIMNTPIDVVWAGGESHATNVDRTYDSLRFNVLTGIEQISGERIPGWGL